jgi:hypothetical protein
MRWGSSSSLFVDFEKGTLTQGGNYTNHYFKTASHWGYIYAQNASNIYIYYAPHGSATMTQIKISAAGIPIGVSGNVVWLLTAPANSTNCAICKFDTSTGIYTENVASMDTKDKTSDAGTTTWNLAFTDSSYAYIFITFYKYTASTSTYNYFYFNKLMKVNLSNGSTDFSSLTASNIVANPLGATNSQFNMVGCTATRYAGSINGVAYFTNGYSNNYYITTYNKSSGALSYYKINSSYAPQNRHCSPLETTFNIPSLPGCIITGQFILDTVNGIFEPIAYGDKFKAFGSSYGGGVSRNGTMIPVPVAINNTSVTDTDFVGFIDKNTAVGGNNERLAYLINY